MEKNETSSIFETRGFIKIHETEDGYNVFVSRVISNLKNYLYIEIEGGPQNSWTELKIAESSLRKQNAVVKAVEKKFDNLVGDLATEDTKQSVAHAIETKWELIPTADLGSLSSPTAIYHSLFKYAEGKIEGTIFMHDGYCYILAKEFNAVLEELRFRGARSGLLNSFRMLNILVANTNRNERNKKFPWMPKEDRFICLRSLEQQAKSTENDVTVQEPSADAKERYVEQGDGLKNTLGPYPGGKNNIPMQDKILALIPHDITKFVEPFAGSGSITYNLRWARYYHLNDLDSNMSNLHSVVTDSTMVDKLLGAIEKCSFSKEEFTKALERSKKAEHSDKVEWAVDELLLMYCSFNVDRKDYCSKGSIEKLKKRIKRNIGRIFAKSQNCEITVTNRNAFDVLKEYCERGDKKTFGYLDPPYLDELISSKNPLYREVPSKDFHREMLSILQNAKCPILLSGYKAEESEKDLYCKYLDKEHGWVCLQLGAFHKSSSGKEGSTGIEYVWLNYFDRIPENAKYFVSMKNHGLEKGGADNE